MPPTSANGTFRMIRRGLADLRKVTNSSGKMIASDSGMTSTSRPWRVTGSRTGRPSVGNSPGGSLTAAHRAAAPRPRSCRCRARGRCICTTSRRWLPSWLIASGACDRAIRATAAERHLFAARRGQHQAAPSASASRAHAARGTARTTGNALGAVEDVGGLACRRPRSRRPRWTSATFRPYRAMPRRSIASSSCDAPGQHLDLQVAPRRARVRATVGTCCGRAVPGRRCPGRRPSPPRRP